MFRAIISPILRCIILQSSAPEDGRNYRPKHVELILIINKIIIVASSWLFILLYFVQLSDPKIFHEKFSNHLQFSLIRQLSSSHVWRSKYQRLLCLSFCATQHQNANKISCTQDRLLTARLTVMCPQIRHIFAATGTEWVANLKY